MENCSRRRKSINEEDKMAKRTPKITARKYGGEGDGGKMKNKARAIIGYVEDVCSDFGHEAYKAYKEFGTSFTSKETDREIEIMEKNNVHDIGGSLAVNMYSHAGFCEDMLGDRIYDEANGKAEDIVFLAEEVKNQSTNQAMKTACDSIIRRWKDV